MGRASLFFVLLVAFTTLLHVNAYNVTYQFTGLPSNNSLTYQQTSGVIRITPTGALATVANTIVAACSGCVVTPTTFNLGINSTTVQNFTVTPTTATSGIWLYFSQSTDPQFAPISGYAFTARTVSFVFFPSTLSGYSLGVTSLNYTVDSVVPPVTTLFLTPSAPGVVFTPSQINFGSGLSPNQTFTYQANSLGETNITWVLGGPEAPNYNQISYTTVDITLVTYQFSNLPGNNSLSYQQTSPSITVTPSGYPSTVANTLVPSCIGCVVNPPTIYFAPGSTAPQSFTLTVTDVTAYVVLSFSQTSIDEQFAAIPNPLWSFPANQVSFVFVPAKITGAFAGQISSVFQIQPTVAPVTAVYLIPSAPGFFFSPPQINFTSSATQSFTYRATLAGTFNITWNVAGPDAGDWNPVNYTTITISELVLSATPSGSIAFNSLGQLTVQEIHSYLPVNSLTITPSSSAITFNPPSVTLLQATTPFGDSFTFSLLPTASGTYNITYSYSGPDYITPPIWQLPSYTQVTINPLTITLNFPTTSNSLTVGVWSTYYLASLSGLPASDVSFTPSANGNFTFQPATFVFGPTVQVVAYRVVANQLLTSPANITWSITGTDAADVSANFVTVAPSVTGKAAVTVPNILSPVRVGTSQINYPVYLSAAPLHSLTLIVNSTNPSLFTITPGSITFTPGSGLTALFNVTVNTENLPTSANIQYFLTGPDAPSFAITGNSFTTVTTSYPNEVYVPTFSTPPTIVAGNTAGPFSVRLGAAPVTTLTVQLSGPVAPGISPVISFQPSTLNFDPAHLTQQFWVTIDTPTPTATSLPVTYTIAPTGDYQTFAISGTTSFKTSARDASSQLTVNPSLISSYNLNITSNVYELNFGIPPVSFLNVTLFGTGLVFTPPIVTFAPGQLTGTFQFRPTVPTSSVSIYTIFDGDSYYSNPPSFGPFAVVATSISTPSSFTALAIGIPSSPYTVTLSFPSELTITPVAPGVLFSPSVLTFGGPNGVIVQSFTLLASAPISQAAQVEFILGGADAINHATPAPVSLAAVPLRTISVTGLSGTFTVGQTYVGTASVSTSVIITNGVTVTPQGEGIIFNPPTFQFGPSTTVVIFYFTPTVISQAASPSESAASLTISFSLSGPDAVSFNLIPETSISVVPIVAPSVSLTSPLPLAVWSKPNNYINFGSTSLNASVTVTLTSNGPLSFNPPSFIVNANTANLDIQNYYFSVLSSTPGSFLVIPVLSGVDAAYTAVFNPTSIVFVKYTIGFPSFPGSYKVMDNYPSSDAQITTQVSGSPFPPPNWIAVTPSAPGIVFSPSVWNLTAALNSIFVYLTPTAVTTNNVYVTYSVSGPDLPLFDLSGLTYGTISPITTRVVSLPSSLSLAVGVQSTPFPVTVTDHVFTSLTITPVLKNVVFNPTSIVVSPSDQIIYFTATASVNIIPGTYAVDIKFSGPDAQYYSKNNVNFNAVIAARTLTLSTIGSTSYVGVPNVAVLSLSYPALNGLTITPVVQYNGGFEVQPTSYTLTNGEDSTSFVVTALTYPAVFSSMVVTYTVSGPDAQFTDSSSSLITLITISQRSISVPSLPTVYYQIPSNLWAFTLPGPTLNGLQIIPKSHGNVVFTPPVLVFGPGGDYGAFTLVVTQSDYVGLSTSTYYVELELSGPDAYLYTLNTPQISGSVNTPFSLVTSTASTSVAINQPFILEIQLDGSTGFGFPQDFQQLIVTPWAFGTTFSPPSVTLVKNAPSAQITAVVNAIQSSSGPTSAATTTTTIVYDVSGTNAWEWSATTSTVTVSKHTISAPTVTIPSYIHQRSGPFLITLSQPPVSGLVINIVATPGVSFSPSTLYFNNSTYEAEFYLTATAAPSGSITGYYLISGPDTDHYSISSDTFTLSAAGFRSVSLTLPTSLVAGTWSAPITLSATPSPDIGLAVTFGGVGLSFNPPSVTLAAGQYETYFSVLANYESNFLFSPSISGPDAAWFHQISPSYVGVSYRSFSFSPAVSSVSLYVGEQSQLISLSVSYTGTFTVTPIAENTVFTPSVLTFTPSVTSVYFSFELTTFSGGFVTFVVSGPDAHLYSSITPLYVNPTQSTLSWSSGFSSALSGGLSTAQPVFGSATLSHPPLSDVTFTPSGPGLTFVPAQFLFTPTVRTVPFSVTVWVPSSTSYVTFAVSGTNAASYAIPTALPFSAGWRSISISSYSVSITPGRTSNILEALLGSVGANVQVTPLINIPGITFNPPQFVFSPTTSSVPFTITAAPHFGPVTKTITVAWNITGPDAAIFSAISEVTVTVSSRQIVVPSSSTVLTLGEPYLLSASATYAPETNVSVILYGNGLVVNPNVITFYPDTLVAFFTVTSTSYTFGSAQFVLYYALEGVDKDSYSLSAFSAPFSASAQGFNIPTFPSHIYAGVTAGPFTVSIPDGNLGAVILTPSASGLSFTDINGNALTSFAFSFSQTYIDFFVTASSILVDQGTTILWTVSGTQGNYYSVPAPTAISTNLQTFDVSAVPTSINAGAYSPLARPFTIFLTYPALNDVSLTLSAPGVTFEPNVLEFSPTNPAATFSLTASAPSFATAISYTVTGTDAEYYWTPNPSTLTISHTLFTVTVPTNYNLFTGAHNFAFFTAQLSSATFNGLTVTPTGPGLTFNPPALVFTPGQSFVPFQLSYVARPSGSTGFPVYYKLSGPDQLLYTTSPASSTAYIAPKTFATPSYNSLLVGQTSNLYTITVSDYPSVGVTVTLFAPGLTFSPSNIISFGTSDNSKSFTITAGYTFDTANHVPIRFYLSGPSAAEYALISDSSILISLLSLNTPQATNVIAGVPSAPFYISISSVSAEVIVTPTAYGVTFEPEYIVFNSSVTSATFVLTTSFVPFLLNNQPQQINVNYLLSGPGAALISGQPSSIIEVVNRTLAIPSNWGTNYLGVPSTPIGVAVSQLPVTGTLVLTPEAAGVTFTPPSFSFTSATSSAALFSFVVNQYSAGTVPVTWQLSGDNAGFYTVPPQSSFSPSRLPIDVEEGWDSYLLPNQPAYVDISTQYPPPNGITVTPIGGFTFIPPSVSFSPTVQTGRIQVISNAVQTTSVSFIISGPDAAWYTVPDSFSIQTQPISFIGLGSLNSYVDTYPLLGIPSQPALISTSSVPPNGVSLIISSPYLTFSPSVVQISAATPVVPVSFIVNTRVARSVFQHLVSFAVGGPDAALFLIPGSEYFYFNDYLSSPYYSLAITNSLDSNILIAGVPSYFTISTQAMTPPDNVVITPYVPGLNNVVFSPAYASLSASAPFVTFAITVPLPTSTNYAVFFSLTGPSAYLFDNAFSQDLPMVNPNSFSSSYGFENGGTFAPNHYSPPLAIYTNYPPINGVTLTLSSPTGTVSFSPSVLQFTPTQTTQSFTVFANRVSSQELIYYTLSGPDASLFVLPPSTNIYFAAINIYTSASDYGYFDNGNNYYYFSPTVPGTLLFRLSSPPQTGLTLTLECAGFSFSPNPVIIQPGAYYASVQVQTLGLGTYGVAPLIVTLGGTDAPAFVLNQLPSLATQLNGISNSGTFVDEDTVEIGVPYDFTFNLAYPATSDFTITFTPSSFNTLSFTPSQLVIPAGAFSVTTTVVPLVPGTFSFEATFGGAAVLTLGTNNQVITYTTNPRSLQSVGSSTLSTTVGGWTYPFDFSLTLSNGIPAATPNSFNISFLVSPPGAVLFDPPAIFVSYPSTSFAFRASPQALGVFTVSLVVSGVDLPVYDPSVLGDGVTVTVTSTMRKFGIMPATSSVLPTATQSLSDPAQVNMLQINDYYTDIGTTVPLYAGLQSPPITVSVGAISTNVSLVLEGRGLSFNPNVVKFLGTSDSLEFTITPTEAVGPTYVHFSVIGPDSAFFVIPSPIGVVVSHQYKLPTFPVLTVGVPVTLQMSIISNITDAVVVTPQVNNVVFRPESFLFSSSKPTVTFEVVGTSTINVLLYNVNPTITGNSDASYNSLSNNLFYFTWRFVYQDVSLGAVWFPPSGGTIGINVLPATFIVKFPHLQIGLTSTLTVSVNAPPRSDVVLSLIGNNLNFNPTYLLFTPTSTVATVSVTPVHADYKDFETLPFTVDYIVSGTNSADYTPPAQSFLAISRGSAPEADSLVLSAASPVAYQSAALLLLVVSLLAFLL